MPIDPKFFNRFMIITAAVTALVIIISTLAHHTGRTDDFKTLVESTDFRSLSLQRIPGSSAVVSPENPCAIGSNESGINTEATSETIRIGDCKGTPVVILFWATWSGMSMEMNEVAIMTVQAAQKDSANIHPAAPNPDITNNSDNIANANNTVSTDSTNNTKTAHQIVFIAATVRDDPNNVAEYSHSLQAPFIFVDGTDLFHELKATGLPSQIFLDKDGQVSDLQIGKDAEALRKKLITLLHSDTQSPT